MFFQQLIEPIDIIHSIFYPKINFISLETTKVNVRRLIQHMLEAQTLPEELYLGSLTSKVRIDL